MNKDDFMTGKPVFFKFPGDKWNTYKYNPPKEGGDTGTISHDGSYHCNTSGLTKVGIRYYGFVLNKLVKGVLKFSNIEAIAESEYTIH